jgi:hypothetical protein
MLYKKFLVLHGCEDSNCGSVGSVIGCYQRFEGIRSSIFKDEFLV